MCMSSTYGKGEKLASRIVPTMTPGGIITTTRSIVSYIVTEYGMVNLKGISTWERAEALISIAHPQFHEELMKSAQEIGIWRPTNKMISDMNRSMKAA